MFYLLFVCIICVQPNVPSYTVLIHTCAILRCCKCLNFECQKWPSLMFAGKAGAYSSVGKACQIQTL